MKSSSWPKSLPNNQMKAIQELTQGQILTDRLKQMLGQPEKIESNLESFDNTVAHILGMFENAVSFLRSDSSNFNDIPHSRPYEMSFQNKCEDKKPKDCIKSVKSLMPIKTRKGCHKRRKSSSIITNVTSSLVDDGYAWRKYGQKVILKSKHQRNYYRCTHKHEQGCHATKQIQMTNDEPPKYRITYHGHHTCNNLQRAHQIILDYPNPSDNSILLSFETNTLIDRKQVSPFSSLSKHIPEDGFTLSIKHDEASTSDYQTTWDPVTQPSQVPLIPEPIMSYGLDDLEEMVSPRFFLSTCSTHQYEMYDMFGSNDFSDLLSEYLCA